MKSPNTDSTSPEWTLGTRPFCSCCAGGEHRKGYTVTKHKSRKKNAAANRTSHGVDKRSRRMARPDKF